VDPPKEAPPKQLWAERKPLLYISGLVLEIFLVPQNIVPDAWNNPLHELAPHCRGGWDRRSRDIFFDFCSVKAGTFKVSPAPKKLSGLVCVCSLKVLSDITSLNQKAMLETSIIKDKYKYIYAELWLCMDSEAVQVKKNNVMLVLIGHGDGETKW
jgi:hypothetical protein